MQPTKEDGRSEGQAVTRNNENLTEQEPFQVSAKSKMCLIISINAAKYYDMTGHTLDPKICHGLLSRTLMSSGSGRREMSKRMVIHLMYPSSLRVSLYSSSFNK